MRAAWLLLLVVACKSEKAEKLEKKQVEVPQPKADRTVDLPAELAFTCEKILPKAIREELFPEGTNLRGSGEGKPKYYQCVLDTDFNELVIKLDCNDLGEGLRFHMLWVEKLCDYELHRIPGRKRVEVGRVGCVDPEAHELQFVPSKLDCRVTVDLIQEEPQLELAKALDEVYTKATVAR